MKVMNIGSTPNYGASFAVKKQKNKNSANASVVSNTSDVLCDKNYGILQTKSLSFKGGVSTPQLNAVSKKVNNLFNIVRSNDLIVAGSSYKTAIDSLKENVDNIKTVIKRVFFIEDKALDSTIAFKKNLDRKEVVNLSERPLIIKDKKNQTGFLRQGETGFVLDGDTINYGKYDIVIKDNDEVTLPVKDSFTFFVDLDKEVEPKIKEINEKSLSQITVDKKPVPVEHKIMFSDVGGMDSTIMELKKTILYPMKYPELKNGKNMKKSVLLYGPSGTGKSFVAEACANEAGAWFKKINASQLEDKYVGESEKNWTNLFEEARKNQPALIFIDEVDAIGKKRGGADVHGDKTLNTLLGLMSDSEKRGDQIYMIAATNKKEALDDAFTRAGRFGFSVEVPAPDRKGTKDILKIYTSTEKIDKSLNEDLVVDKLYRNKATGADIAVVVENAREAALLREGVYAKIEQGTYKKEDAQNITIKNEDFDNAIEIMLKEKNKNSRKPIGFLSGLCE